MRRTKKPWCIEVEYHPEDDGADRPSEFYVVKRMVADARDLHLLVTSKNGDSKVSIDRRSIARVMMVNSTKEPQGAGAAS